ncbi:MAG: SAM-dependent methyltransferase, partial [Patulibacter sp.]|nr:SAM-dependent methyltransferase [Patulibacter sp.]
SIGDGAFVRALEGTTLRRRVRDVVGFELLETEAEKARQALRETVLPGRVETRSVLDWATREADQRFDLAVGNPPFVRFQFVSAADRAAADVLTASLGLPSRGVANLWIPVLLSALSKLRDGGAFAFVIPAECFTGSSAQVARDWLLANTTELRSDLFPPGSFPGVLQEVTVLSGRRATSRPVGGGGAELTISEHDRAGRERSWTHTAAVGESWTRYLLEPRHLAALAEAAVLPNVRRLSAVAAFEVSIVTGANDFFSVDRETVERYALTAWARPLLPRIRHAAGLGYRPDDHRRTEDDARAWILDFSADRPDPREHEAAAYIAAGEQRDLHVRFKCRIREPWYRVPGVRRGALLLSKRSHDYPRVVVNDAAVLTTDTIYRGRLLDPDVAPRAFAAGFHSSLTMLSAEIEGRSFAGGVLELVPSEVGRLLLPVAPGAGAWFDELDAGLREDPTLDLVDRTDELLVQTGALPRDLLGTLADARRTMRARRFGRRGASG